MCGAASMEGQAPSLHTDYFDFYADCGTASMPLIGDGIRQGRMEVLPAYVSFSYLTSVSVPSSREVSFFIKLRRWSESVVAS